MTKADLIEEVSRVAEIKNKEAEVVVNTILASIVDTVRGGGKVEIRGFGRRMSGVPLKRAALPDLYVTRREPELRAVWV